jgi:hypothetical protein
MKRIISGIGLLLIMVAASHTLNGQAFSKSKPKIGLSAEYYGLGIDNFGILNSQGKEILDLKEIKYEDQINLAFYNVNGFEVNNGLTHLRMNITIVNQTDNQVFVVSESLLDESMDPAKLKDDYIYGYMTMTKDFFIKGKTYMLRLHLWDVASGKGVDMVWKFKANFK